MATQVRLFVSAGPAEEGAREQLGRALAGLPINVGWVIKRTPDVESVAECHLFALLLGNDIVAPVGLELWWARRTEKPILAYAAGGPRTPACQVFYQDNSYLHWQPFNDYTSLRRAFLLDTGHFLLRHAERYGVTVPEAEALRAFMAALEKPVTGGTREGPVAKAQGVGGGGVILAPGKDMPPGARLIGDE